MSTAAERLACGLKQARKTVASVHPENLGFTDTVLLRSTLLKTLQISEQLATIIHEDIYMTTKTRSKDSDVESAYESALADNALGSIDQLLEQQRHDGEIAYRQIALDIAEGRRVDPAKLRDALIDASRTKEDLKRHVGMIGKRLQAYADRNRADELAATLPELKSKCDAATAALREKETEYRKSIEPLLAASRTTAEDYANCDVTVKSLRSGATNSLNQTVGHDFAKEFKRLSNHVSGFDKKIAAAKSFAARAKEEFPVLQAKIAKLEGEVLREQSRGNNEPLIVQLNEQINRNRALLGRMASCHDEIAGLIDEKKAAEAAMEEFMQKGVSDPANIRWSNDGPVW